MKKKTTNYTWNEDLQRVIAGDMPQDIEALQHDKNEAGKYKFPIDDHSNILPRGYRRSEEYIAERVKQERKKRDRQNASFENKRAKTIERQNSHSDLNEFGRNADVKIPHNQNRASASEIREDYIWKIPLVLVVLFIIGIYILTNFGR